MTVCSRGSSNYGGKACFLIPAINPYLARYAAEMI